MHIYIYTPCKPSTFFFRVAQEPPWGVGWTAYVSTPEKHVEKIWSQSNWWTDCTGPVVVNRSPKFNADTLSLVGFNRWREIQRKVHGQQLWKQQSVKWIPSPSHEPIKSSLLYPTIFCDSNTLHFAESQPDNFHEYEDTRKQLAQRGCWSQSGTVGMQFWLADIKLLF